MKKTSKELTAAFENLKEAARPISLSTLVQLSWKLQLDAKKRMEELEHEHVRHSHFLKLSETPHLGCGSRDRQDILKSLDGSIFKQAQVVVFTQALHAFFMYFEAQSTVQSLIDSGLFDTILGKKKR